MCRKPMKGLDGSAVKRFKNDVINDLISELGRDGLDDHSVRELIRGLLRKYPENVTIIQLNEAIGIEPEHGDTNLVHMVHSGNSKCASTAFYRAIGRVIMCFPNIEQSKLEAIISEAMSDTPAKPESFIGIGGEATQAGISTR